MTFRDAVQRARARWIPWKDFTTARRLQEELAHEVFLCPYTGPLRYFCGVDCAFLDNPPRVIAGAVLWDAHSSEIRCRSIAILPCPIPYVPGYLSFREIPAILEALEGIDHRVDMVIVDGQGIAHPRRFGLAAHLGVLLDYPTVGVGKSRLTGVFRLPNDIRGCFTPLWSPHDAALIGTVIRTRPGVKPVFASPGHKIDFIDATHIVMACTRGYRLPEPQRWADQLVRSAKRGGFGL